MKRIFVLLLIGLSCSAGLALWAKRSGTQHPKLSFDLARLAEGPCISNGRLQDTNETSHARRELMDKIMSHGTDSIQVLAAELTSSHPVQQPLRCDWHGTAVGDVALLILLDLFRDHNLHSTVPELEWDTFLERSSPDLTQEEVLRDFLRNHHRNGLEEKWASFWTEHKDEVIWDTQELCYRMRPGHPK